MKAPSFLGGCVILVLARTEASAAAAQHDDGLTAAEASTPASSERAAETHKHAQADTPPTPTQSSAADPAAPPQGSSPVPSTGSARPQSSSETSQPIESPAPQNTTPPAGPISKPGEPRIPPCKSLDGEAGLPAASDCSGVFGIRGAVTRLSGANAPNEVGLMLSGEGEEYVRRGIWSTRNVYRLGIGGGGAGFEGALLGGFAGGVRIPVGAHHGPVLRAGVFAYMRGNDRYYESLLELPQLQVGYQYLRGNAVLEVGMTAGTTLTGRSRTGETLSRHLGAGFDVGGYAALRVPGFRLGLMASRLPANDELSSSVRIAEGTVCALLAPLAICADARATFTDALASPMGPASEVRSLQAGLVVGFTREP